MFAQAAVAMLNGAENDNVRDRITRLMRELAWAGRGHAAATRSEVLGVMVAALRASEVSGARAVAPPGHHAALVARFRHRVEECFRFRHPVEKYASDLGGDNPPAT